MNQIVKELYGLKIDDSVQYIGNNENHFSKNLFNRKGKVKSIIPATGEFHVKLEGIEYAVSFQRYELLLLDSEEIKEVNFESQLTNDTKLTLNDMRSYLKKYHNLIEGKHFSLSNVNENKEVMLNNEKYALLIKELLTVNKVTKELTSDNTLEFKHTMLPEISKNGSISISFQISDWKFRTHLSPWGVQYSLLFQYGIDLYEEWGLVGIQK